MPVVWITGLSGAGKSTLAREVTRQLRDRGNCAIMLDGDELREVFDDGPGDGFSRDDRLVLARRYGRLCGLLATQHITVVIATISLFRDIHAWNRAHLPGYVEVFLDVPEEERRRRDSRGLYRRYDAGEIRNVAGLDLPVDEPETPDLRVTFDPGRPVAAVAATVVGLLEPRDAPEPGRGR